MVLTKLSLHLVKASNLIHKGPLERVDVGVELLARQGGAGGVSIWLTIPPSCRL